MTLTPKVVTNVRKFGTPKKLKEWRKNSDKNQAMVEGQWLWTDGVPWHQDTWTKPFSALLVVKNTGITVETRSESVTPEAKDLLILNIHEDHRAIGNGELLCLFEDFDVMPTPEEALMKILYY